MKGGWVGGGRGVCSNHLPLAPQLTRLINEASATDMRLRQLKARWGCHLKPGWPGLPSGGQTGAWPVREIYINLLADSLTRSSPKLGSYNRFVRPQIPAVQQVHHYYYLA